MELTEKQQGIMDADGHLLVTGGPGSGKTTVSILRAARIVEKILHSSQKVLFLSFARATVSRVIEAIEYEQKIPHEQKRQINVETYHSFFWQILKTHGYLAGLPRRLSILTPPEEAIVLSIIRSDYEADSKLSDEKKTEKRKRENEERHRLAYREGRVCFDLFAQIVGNILHGSERIRRLIATMYPEIILDEFQDTNSEQWNVVQALGEFSNLIALGDPGQRIYDFLGADPERLNHFKGDFSPKELDLSAENHRSAGTDILGFGNDIVGGQFNKQTYAGIEIYGYPQNNGQAYSSLVTQVYKARERLIKNGNQEWSLAILVPTKKMTRSVSDIFRAPPANMKPIPHIASVELEGAILGAEVIAFLMEPDKDSRHFESFVQLLRNYFHGRGGDAPTKSDLGDAESIQRAFVKWLKAKSEGKDPKRSIMVAIFSVYSKIREFVLTGDPEKDWLMVRFALETGDCPRLKGLAEEVKNLRLLDRGAQLRQELSQDWRDN